MLPYLLSTGLFLKTNRELKTVVSQHDASLQASDQQDNGVTASSLPERAGVSAKEADPTAAHTVSGLQLEGFFGSIKVQLRVAIAGPAALPYLRESTGRCDW